MDILLLNDSSYVRCLPSTWRVMSAGPRATYNMPEQDRFDVWLNPVLDQDLSAVLALCRSKVPDFDPDVIILFETAQNYFYRGIERSRALTLWRVIDSHLFGHWQPMYGQLFDAVLVAQKEYVPAFQGQNPESHWLPLNCNRTVHGDRGLPRTLEASFVGSMDPGMHPVRVEFFRTLQTLAPVHVYSGQTQEALGELYNRSQVVVNECLYKDLNYRIFEAMANGALCLTPDIDAGLRDLFVPDEDLVLYEDRNPQDAARQLSALLANPERLEAIRRSGYQKVMQHHELENRVADVTGLIERLLEARPARPLTPKGLWPVLSLLAEFTFGLKKLGGRHLDDLARHCLLEDPTGTGYYLASLAASWLKRGDGAAGAYLTSLLEGIAQPDPRLAEARATLKRVLGTLPPASRS